MNDFHIFGDSFGENPLHSDSPEFCWFNNLKLKVDGTVFNYCLGCTGPIENLKLLLEKKLKDTNIIFLLSIKYRIPFPFSKERGHSEDFKEIHDSRTSPRKEVNYALEWLYEIDMVYNMFGDEIEMSPFLCILYLHFYALKNNCKILIFLCDPNDVANENYFYFNNEHFKVHRKNIWHMSQEEFRNRIIDPIEEEKRVSHISECNHTIMFNIILNFFMNTSYNESFYQNLYDGSKEKIKNRFIYD